MIRQTFWLLPLLLLLSITPWISQWDLSLSALFYDTTTETFQQSALLRWIFKYGCYPAILLSLLALFTFALSFKLPSLQSYRAPALLLVLTMVIGSGIITHLILKNNWGRPRPKQIIAFSGQQKFRPYYSPNFYNSPEPSRSFPSGHVSTGYFYLTLSLIGYRKKKPLLILSGILLTFLFAGTLSYLRIAQGGHFFSDTLFAGIVMWYTALVCEWLIYEKFSRLPFLGEKKCPNKVKQKKD